MAQIPMGTRIAQEKMGAAAEANPTGSLLFVDSSNGNDGNDGTSPRHAVLTLTRAVALAQAGDTILLNPGGSETVTAAIAIALAGLKVICPVANPRSGFAISGAGTLDLISVTAADVTLQGLQLKHTGATANASGVLGSAAAHRLTVRHCVVDDIAITTTKTGVGVEITAGADDVLVEDCAFLDTKYGVQIAASSTNESDRPVIRGCTFHVGGSAWFGVHAASATGKVQAPVIADCVFLEADGDGSAATAAWDGTDGTNGTQGPILFGAAVDQYLIANCIAYTALDSSFDLLNAINSGAAGDLVSCRTGAGGDIQDTADTINTAVGTVDAATTDSLHGKIGTDTEMADNSLFDLLVPVEATGDADVDISEADYTADYVTLLTVAPAAGQALLDLAIDLDVNKATTGWDTIATAADTIDLAVQSKVDGTNWRTLMTGTQITANGDGSLLGHESGQRFHVGPVGVNAQVRVVVLLSAERDDCEIPYRVTYRGATPTITPVAAA